MRFRLEDQDEPTREALTVLGGVFRGLRTGRGLTQRQLEARSGVSQSTISRFENGKAPWLAAVQIARLLAALDLEPGLLGFGEKAVPNLVPAWVTLMDRFELRRRRADLQAFEQRRRIELAATADRRMELARRRIALEALMAPDESELDASFDDLQPD
ncbi:MAG: helix-turn-helix transcriptional regulator [Chloroflexota bacterium]